MSETALRLNVSILGDGEPSYLITLTSPDPDISIGISESLRTMHAICCDCGGVATTEASVRRGTSDASISMDVAALHRAFGDSNSCPLRLCVEQWDRLGTVRAAPPDVHILVPIHVLLCGI
jgi:hypothetical protein